MEIILVMNLVAKNRLICKNIFIIPELSFERVPLNCTLHILLIQSLYCSNQQFSVYYNTFFFFFTNVPKFYNHHKLKQTCCTCTIGESLMQVPIVCIHLK